MKRALLSVPPLVPLLPLLLWAGRAEAQNAVELASDEQCLLADTGRVALRIDSYGAFGSAVPTGGRAMYDPEPTDEGIDWPVQSTTFESMAHLCVEGPGGGGARGNWLEAGRMGLNAADFRVEDGALLSDFEWRGVDVHLEANLNCNVLTECWTFTNTTDEDMGVVALTHYIDADLYFVGGLGNDYGGTDAGPPRTVFQFDSGDDPESPTTYIGLSNNDPADRHFTSWEVGEFSEQRTRIGAMAGGRCTALREDLQRGEGADADRNDDLITDSGYDVTIALRFDLGPLPAGERTEELCIDITWGVGFACGDPDEDGICSSDDICPFTFDPPQTDTDGDGVGDECDNCRLEVNADQVDRDGDGIGDECDKYVCRDTNDGLEACDGLDNDCDGRTDNIRADAALCATGLPGVCARGTPVCGGGEIVCVAPRAPDGGRREVCNLLDDDCDGQVDEDVRNACGRCGAPPAEMCDGIDNDCDGGTDLGELCDEAAGYRCVLGKCRVPCAGGDGCRESEVCSDGWCTSVEETEDGSACDDAACPPDTICDRLGRCGPCQAVGCPEGKVCIGGARCIPDPCHGVACRAGEACVDGQCQASCGAVACPVGERCRQGRCLPDPCGGVECGEGLRCGEDGQCVADECVAAASACEVGQICDRGQCLPNPCITARCPQGERCEAVCVRGACAAQCFPDWGGDDVVGDDGPAGDPAPGGGADDAAGAEPGDGPPAGGEAGADGAPPGQADDADGAPDDTAPGEGPEVPDGDGPDDVAEEGEGETPDAEPARAGDSGGKSWCTASPSEVAPGRSVFAYLLRR